MKIKRITVRAGRVVPHPLYQYGNLKGDIEYVADLEEGEDAEEARKELQGKAESDIEQHMYDLKQNIRGLQDQVNSREKIARLESELESKSKELNDLKSEFDDRPLLAPKSSD